MTLHEGFENEIAKSFIGFISNVCIFAASYEVKARDVLTIDALGDAD